MTQNNTLTCDPCRKIQFIKNKRILKTKQVVCLQRCNPSSSVKKIKVEIELPAIHCRRKFMSISIQQYMHTVSKILGKKLNYKIRSTTRVSRSSKQDKNATIRLLLRSQYKGIKIKINTFIQKACKGIEVKMVIGMF